MEALLELEVLLLQLLLNWLPLRLARVLQLKEVLPKLELTQLLEVLREFPLLPLVKLSLVVLVAPLHLFLI